MRYYYLIKKIIKIIKKNEYLNNNLTYKLTNLQQVFNKHLLIIQPIFNVI